MPVELSVSTRALAMPSGRATERTAHKTTDGEMGRSAPVPAVALLELGQDERDERETRGNGEVRCADIDDI